MSIDAKGFKRPKMPKIPPIKKPTMPKKPTIPKMPPIKKPDMPKMPDFKKPEIKPPNILPKMPINPLKPPNMDKIGENIGNITRPIGNFAEGLLNALNPQNMILLIGGIVVVATVVQSSRSS